MKDTVRVVNYSWADRVTVSRDNTAAIIVDVTADATPGQLEAAYQRIKEEKGWA